MSSATEHFHCVQVEPDKRALTPFTLFFNWLHHLCSEVQGAARSVLQPCRCQIHQIIFKEAPGQFNPTGRHAKTLSLPIFTLSLIQASSFFLQLHNAGSCFTEFFFPCSLISFLSMAATPQNPSDSMQFMQMTSLSFSG